MTQRGRMFAFLLRRLRQAAVMVFGIALVNFFFLRMIAGDAADTMAAEAGAADAEYLEHLRQQMGLDQPLLVQLGQFLWRLVQFDLGYSHRNGEEVAVLVLDRLPATLLLMGASISIAVVLGTIMGVVAARNVNRAVDSIISFVALVFYATPLFWIGLMSIVLFSVHLGWLPTGGMRSVGMGLEGWDAVVDVARHLVMPALTLSLFFLALYTRLVRSSMLEIYNQDYIRLARAKGIARWRVDYRHALRNALLPLLTMVGMQVSAFLGGSVLVETVFSWPGLGRLMFDAVFQRDFDLLLGILVLSSVLVILVNLIVDLLYFRLNPTIEVEA